MSLMHSACMQRRMLVQQSGLSESATCIVVGEEQLHRVAPLCPPACQLISVRAAAELQHAAPQPDARRPDDSIGSTHEILRHVVTSQTAEGTSFVIGLAMKRQRALALAERGFVPMVPTDGLCFLPLDLSRDLRPQLQGPLHAILHKACALCRWQPSTRAVRLQLYYRRMSCSAQGSDELVMGTDGQLQFSAAFERLVSFQAAKPHIALIDPIDSLRKVRQTACSHRPPLTVPACCP